MTTRPGGGTVHALRLNCGKRVATLSRIQRQDGFVLRVSDHDRTVTFEGQTYRPVIMGELSADRREAAFRSGNQEARGVIDGETVTIQDFYGNRYRGAEVRQVTTDWSRPWQWVARHRKWIRSVVRQGDWWTATLEGRSQVLMRPSAGPRGGSYWPTCKKQLGLIGPGLCNKDISIGTGFSGAGARVASVVKARHKATFVVASWPGTFLDDYFRDGSFEWIWAAAVDTGTATSTTTDNFVTDTAQAWTENEHVGRYVRILTGVGEGVDGEAYARITSNTATALGYADNQAMADFPIGTDYDICPEAENLGVVSPIVGYEHATRSVDLLLPTPFEIAVGDSGIWSVGCDGLGVTCKDKFDNRVNFGGDDEYAPTGQDTLRPPQEA